MDGPTFLVRSTMLRGHLPAQPLTGDP